MTDKKDAGEPTIDEDNPYTGEPAYDNDPNTETVWALGKTSENQPGFSAIFMENIRDIGAQCGWTPAQLQLVRKGTTLHEIGHQMGVPDHPPVFPNQVMSVPANPSICLMPTLVLVFRDEELKLFRGITSHP